MTSRGRRTLLAALCAWGASTLTPAGAQPSPTQPASAPASAPAAPDSAAPCTLRVTADFALLRSRGDVNSLPIARLPRDTVLRAVGQSYGWHRVLPPDGVFSWAAAEYIERTGESTGVVNVQTGTLRVRVGSLLYDVNPLECEVQARLERGATVRILGQQDAWLKIAPPAGVYFYIADSQVTATDSAGSATTRPTVASRPAETPDLTGPWGRRLVEVEQLIAAQSVLPILDADWTTFAARLEPIIAQREEPAVARLARAWLERVAQRTIEQDAARAAEDVIRRAERERAIQTRELERLERLASRPASAPAFAAEGELQRTILAGPETADPNARAAGLPRFKLIDPLTRRLVVYLVFESEARAEQDTANAPAAALAAKADPLVGRLVGVKGDRRADPDLGADVVRVSEIVNLAPAPAPASQPARPQP